MQRMFIGAFTLVMSVILLSFGAQAAQVGSSVDAGKGVSNSSLVQNVTYSGRCKRWAFRCSERWGFGSSRFANCMKRHDCSVGNRCDRWKRRCRREYGHGYSYRSCLRRHNCYAPAPVYNRCKRWKLRCSESFGYKTKKYFRCMRRHDC